MQPTNTTLPPELHRWVVDWAMIGSAVMIGFLALILSTLVLASYATFVSAQTFPMAYAPRWIIICWLIPVIGPLATLKAAKKYKQTEVENEVSYEGSSIKR
jgi:hypothetical protein